MLGDLLPFKLSPILLITMGFCSELLGALIISVDAIGIERFLPKVKSDKEYERRMTELYFTSLTNNAAVFIAFGVAFVIVLLIIGVDIVLSLLMLPIGFFVHKLISYILKSIHDFIRRLQPELKNGCLNSLIGIGKTVVWASFYLFSGIIWAIFNLGLDIVVRFVTEEVVQPIVIRFFEWYNKKYIKRAERAHIKGHIILGILFIFFGFLYQIAGTILVAIT